METILDSQAIQELLPHRFPFLLVDRIIELVPRERIVGIKQVSINEPFFQGHFPGAPVMPGVLVVEALAQVGAVLALREIEDRDSKLVLFTGIREARFRKPVVPWRHAYAGGHRVTHWIARAANARRSQSRGSTRCRCRNHEHHRGSRISGMKRGGQGSGVRCRKDLAMACSCWPLITRFPDPLN